MQDQDKIIKGIFLEEIVLECALNKLSIKDYKPALYFNTKIQDINKTFGDLTDDRKPVLEINNINKFLDILTEYVKEAIYFYYDGDFSHDNIKMVSSLVFAITIDSFNLFFKSLVKSLVESPLPSTLSTLPLIFGISLFNA